LSGLPAPQQDETVNTLPLWPRLLQIVGSIAMLLGAIDPMEGSLLILPGSGTGMALFAVLGVIGLVTIVGCLFRLITGTPQAEQPVPQAGLGR
jgi:hypothetical protein